MKKFSQAWHWKVVGGVVALLAAVTGLLAWLVPDPLASSPARPTTVSIYDPVDATANGMKPESEELACAKTSRVSPRRGAHTCIGVGMLFDPCFERDDIDTVSCPGGVTPNGLNSSVYHVSGYSEFYFDQTLLPFQKGADSAVKESAPWMIELDRKVNDRPAACYALAADTPRRLDKNDAMSYWCGPRIIFLKDAAAFKAGRNNGAFQYQPREGGRAVGLRKDGDIWKIEYAPFGNADYGEAGVTRAWF